MAGNPPAGSQTGCTDAQTRWRGLIPADYGEQVHRVAERFAILEAALVAGALITGWSEQASRDAIQHSFNAWVKEFGTGNKEHQQIIEQCEAFLNAYGLSRFAPLPYDPTSLPISNLAGYRKRKSSHDDAPMVFYTFPATFEKEIAQTFNVSQFARALIAAGCFWSQPAGVGISKITALWTTGQRLCAPVRYRKRRDLNYTCEAC
jgi:putative DNA primase/helicase